MINAALSMLSVIIVKTTPRNESVIFQGDEDEFLDEFLRARDDSDPICDWSTQLERLIESDRDASRSSPSAYKLVDHVVYALDKDYNVVALSSLVAPSRGEGKDAAGTHVDVYCSKEPLYAWLLWAARRGPPVLWTFRDEEHMLSFAPEVGVDGQARRDWYLRAHEAVSWRGPACGEPIIIRGACRKTYRLVSALIPLGSLAGAKGS